MPRHPMLLASEQPRPPGRRSHSLMDSSTPRTNAPDWRLRMSQDDVSMTYTDDARVTAAGMFGDCGIFILQLINKRVC